MASHFQPPRVFFFLFSLASQALADWIINPDLACLGDPRMKSTPVLEDVFLSAVTGVRELLYFDEKRLMHSRGGGFGCVGATIC